MAKQLAPNLDVSKEDVSGFTMASEAFFPVYKQQQETFLIKTIGLDKRKRIAYKNSYYTKNFTKGLEQPPDFHL